MTDIQLIENFLNGDVNAFNTLVWRWQKPIFNFTLKYLNNVEDAKDITQRTFIKVHGSLDKLKEKEKFSSWIYQIALNQCRDETKRKKNKNNYSFEEMRENIGFDISNEADESGMAEHNPTRKLHRNELNGILSSALAEIPQEQKEIVLMKEYQGLKFIEIADVLGLPVNTVKSRMYYGLKALRKQLEKWNLDKEMLQYEM
ncbi:MAG: RNA polymerase sigma factor [Calditrichaeota bacterium]|nr:MAG: RNA polymerase sigma factor [Calditrichota bacterium]